MALNVLETARILPPESRVGNMVLGTISRAKRHGIITSVEGALNPNGAIAYSAVNPEERRPELLSPNVKDIVIDKNQAVGELLEGEVLEPLPHVIATVDVVTVLIHGTEHQRTELHRLNRIKQNPRFKKLNKERKAQALAEMYEREKNGLIAMCCNGNFVIEWHVAHSVRSVDGQLDKTDETVIRGFFNPLDTELVAKYFSIPDDGQEPEAMKYGPRLPWAEFAAQGHATLALMARDEEISEVQLKDIYHWVVECQLPPSIINALIAYYLESPSPDNFIP